MIQSEEDQEQSKNDGDNREGLEDLRSSSSDGSDNHSNRTDRLKPSFVTDCNYMSRHNHLEGLEHHHKTRLFLECESLIGEQV